MTEGSRLRLEDFEVRWKDTRPQFIFKPTKQRWRSTTVRLSQRLGLERVAKNIGPSEMVER
jgi:hypothetical protein